VIKVVARRIHMNIHMPGIFSKTKAYLRRYKSELKRL
jgi:hypothetical protein